MGIFGDASVTTIAGFIIISVAFLLQLIGFSTPYWMVVSNGFVDYRFGLWQMCAASTCSKACDAFICGDDFKGAQAMATLGFIVLLVAVVMVSLKLFVLKDQSIVKMVGVCCCFVGGAFALIGAIIFGTLDIVQAENLHFSFAFCIIAAIGGVVAGVLLIIGK